MYPWFHATKQLLDKSWCFNIFIQAYTTGTEQVLITLHVHGGPWLYKDLLCACCACSDNYCSIAVKTSAFVKKLLDWNQGHMINMNTSQPRTCPHKIIATTTKKLNGIAVAYDFLIVWKDPLLTILNLVWGVNSRWSVKWSQPSWNFYLLECTMHTLPFRNYFISLLNTLL